VPVRARDLARALAGFGILVEAPKKGGSHWRAVRGGTVYPLPMHNGPKTEVDDAYVRGVCKAFGIAEAELRKKL